MSTMTISVMMFAVSLMLLSGGKAEPKNETELLFVLMVHRNGNRTPLSKSYLTDIYLDNEEIRALVDKQGGYGQLTNAGIRTAYKTGEFIRRRYNALLSPKYNESEIYIYSTDEVRAKMSALSAMAAVFPPTADAWSHQINWVPVPYTTTPGQYDGTLMYKSCPGLILKYRQSDLSAQTFNWTKDEHRTVPNELAGILTQPNVRDHLYGFLHAHDTLTSLMSLGYHIEERLQQLFPAVSSAADEVWDYYFGDEETAIIQAGVLLNEFFIHADKVISGKPTERVRVYSAHDLNVYSLEAVSGVPRQGRPKFGSLYALELRRLVGTELYAVLPVYLADPHLGVEKYLQVRECGESCFCEYNQFKDLTSKYSLDVNTWKSRCSTN